MLKEYKTYFLCVLIGVVFGMMLLYILMPNKVKEVYITTPVERIVYDTLYVRRDSIIYKTQYIKDIQHDTIEKIRTLNDSSTLELFYKLVAE